ncbi:hypothetical protein MSG28_007119 [Choristoneura fumiferana]|uniref:Uncharacterized protein n=1 Tax=Choristoneura fumiferana TaxID=7141 RepID=A0ACC0JMK6_CHOFU|nr:hypothetical protein MSG28_007119 [Choristoneura fumiferana]
MYRDVDREQQPRSASSLAPRSPVFNAASPYRTPSPMPATAFRGAESLPRSTPVPHYSYPPQFNGEQRTVMLSPTYSTRTDDTADESIGSQHVVNFKQYVESLSCRLKGVFYIVNDNVKCRKVVQLSEHKDIGLDGLSIRTDSGSRAARGGFGVNIRTCMKEAIEYCNQYRHRAAPPRYRSLCVWSHIDF